MKRRHLVVLVSAVTLLTIVFVAAVTVGVGVGTDAGREQIRTVIEAQLKGRIHGKLHIGKVSGGLLTGFTLDSFAIRDLEDSILVSTGKISLEYDPRDLMDRRLLLRNVRVEHPVFRMRQYEKGDWNFQRIFRAGGRSTPDVPGRSFGDFIVLDSVRVVDGTYVLIRPWEPDDTLTGARRDSAIRANVANPDREIRRNTDGLTHAHRWSRLTAFAPHIRLAHPDSDTFGQLFEIAAMNVEELEPPFSIRNARGTVRKVDDSVFVDMRHFDLPASTGSGIGKIWWGSGLPVRLDLHIKADSVALNDVAWVYPTLPRTGGGRTDLRITNNAENPHLFEYALTNMDVRSTKSRLKGAMTFVVGGPVLAVRDVALEAAPVNFDFLRTLAGAPFPVDWQGDLSGTVRGPGGPLTHFVVDASDITWRDPHVAGATSRFRGSGELDILDPALTSFHGFAVDVAQLDLRSIEYLFPSFPRLGGTIAGTATLDSSWLDVRFSNANVTHRNGPGDPSRITGAGHVTWGEQFMTYDVAVNAQPLSLTMLARAYPLGLKGLMSGPIRAKGTTNDLQLTTQLSGAAGTIQYAGRVDAYPLSVAARGEGRVDSLDISQLVVGSGAPAGWLTGTFALDVRGDTNDIGTLHGSAALDVERGDVDDVRVFPSRVRARFADRRVLLDTVRIESAAATVTATGALGLTRETSDSLRYSITADSLGGLRRYVTRLTSSWAQPAGAATDSLSGSMNVTGTLRGSLRSLDASGDVTGTDVFVRREAGRQITGRFDLSNVLAAPSGSAFIRFTALDVGGVMLDTLGASIRFEAAKTGVFSVGALGHNGVIFDAHGDLALADSGTALVVRGASVKTDSSTWSLRGVSNVRRMDRGLSIDSLVLANGRGGRVSVEGLVPRSGRARVFLRADSVALHDVGRVAQLRAPLSGWVNLTAQGAGTDALPLINAQTTLRDVRYGGVRLERVTGSAEYANGRATVALDLSSEKRVVLVARGSLPVQVKYFGARLLQDSLRATLRTDSASFDIVEAVVPALRDATGRLIANLDISGTWEHPDVSGALRVENGEVTIDTLGIRLRGVNVDLALFGHRDSLAIRRFVAWNGTGPADSVSLRGYVAYGELDNPYLNLRLDARTFRALDRRSLARLDVSTEPRNGVRLRGKLRGATLTGGLVVDRGTIYLPDPELLRKQLGDVTQAFADTTALRPVAARPRSRLLESVLLDSVRVTLGDEVWLRSREANIKLAGSLNVQRSPITRAVGNGLGGPGDAGALPVLDGELRAERGTYTLSLNVVQREFQVEGGTITFFGASNLAPELDIAAIHTVRTENGADLRIRVRLTGPLYPNPIVSLESAESFALSQSDLVSYLLFGQPNFELGNDRKSYVQLAARTLFPSAQTLVASELRGILGSWADIVQIRAGSADPSALTSANDRGRGLSDIFWTSRLGLEKQVTDNLFVSVGTGICQFQSSQNGTNQWLDLYNGLSGKLEFRLSRDASIKAGKEPSALSCDQRSSGRLVPTPTQWGLSLFKTWRF